MNPMDQRKFVLPAEAAIAESGPAAEFIVNPDDAHIRASGEALAELAAIVSSENGRDNGNAVRVRLAHVDGQGFLRIELYGFATYDYDNDRQPMRDVAAGDE